MGSINEAERSLLLLNAEGEEPDAAFHSAGLMSIEEREAHGRHLLRLLTWRERLVDAIRRVWDGPAPNPLTDEEMRMIMQPREDDGVPELVPPDDPERLAWEAELRARGYTPARVWNWPERTRIPKATVWERLKYRLRGG